MFEHKKLREPEDFFINLNGRADKCVYFYRINAFSERVDSFIRRYYEASRTSGVVIEGRISNPDEKNLAYYSEIMGSDFLMSVGFIAESLRKWLPRMNDFQRKNVSEAVYDALDLLRKSGKNENMLKNAYIKFMCWLYYKFERITAKLGEDNVPKILYEGTVSKYELMLLSILSCAGCDVVLLQYGGDNDYLKLDPGSELSDSLELPGMSAFPKNFSLAAVREEIRADLAKERLYGEKPQIVNCTNAWIGGKGLADILTPVRSRGNDPRFYYNCFCRINGAEDKLTYQSEMFRFQSELKASGRKIVILEKCIAPPTPEEISSIIRRNYTCPDQMLTDLSANINFPVDPQLRLAMKKAFIDVMLEESGTEGAILNKLTNRAVYLLCWLRRYYNLLFKNWKMPEIACFILFGGCKTGKEALFLKLLAKLPADVLILKPDLNSGCVLYDRTLYEINYSESLAIERFPQENPGVRIGTAAYHAERELDTLMYSDSGLYRDKQHSKASSVVLCTMYEEIAILWDQELKYRPNFSADGDSVTVPVIFAKVSGVKDGAVPQYWQSIKNLITDDTFVIKKAPFIAADSPNPVKAYAAEFFRNGKLRRDKIMSHKCYRYGFLREEIQNHILDKLQLLIDSKIIRGTFENGMEYAIIAAVLNMNKEIVRMIQKFDFTKKNPKIIYINTGESIISPEDSILTAFLSLAGFDVVFFVPTGYQSVEKHFAKGTLDEHQAGEYVYDLRVPDFNAVSSNTRLSWRDKIFKRGT